MLVSADFAGQISLLNLNLSLLTWRSLLTSNLGTQSLFLSEKYTLGQTYRFLRLPVQCPFFQAMTSFSASVLQCLQSE